MRYTTPLNLELVSFRDYTNYLRNSELGGSSGARDSSTKYSIILNPVNIRSSSEFKDLFEKQREELSVFWVKGRHSIADAKKELLSNYNHSEWYKDIFLDSVKRGRLVVEYKTRSCEENKKGTIVPQRDDFTFISNGRELTLGKFLIRQRSLSLYKINPSLTIKQKRRGGLFGIDPRFSS